MHTSHPLREDVSWNVNETIPNTINAVILFVRMWVEIQNPLYFLLDFDGHPLREDVSWNVIAFPAICTAKGHPLREDVSWNIRKRKSAGNNSGHPLREDVSWNENLPYESDNRFCHPLREDVSWNIISQLLELYMLVILFVRMWVEISSTAQLINAL